MEWEGGREKKGEHEGKLTFWVGRLGRSVNMTLEFLFYFILFYFSITISYNVCQTGADIERARERERELWWTEDNDPFGIGSSHQVKVEFSMSRPFKALHVCISHPCISYHAPDGPID